MNSFGYYYLYSPILPMGILSDDDRDNFSNFGRVDKK